MDLEELSVHIGLVLDQYRVKFKQRNLIRDLSYQFIVEDFGLVVSCINAINYTQILEALQDVYPNWNYVFVSTDDVLAEKSDEILFDLMRAGYMKWLRYSYPNQVKNTLFGYCDLAYRIINERLIIWNNLPKYKFLIEDNKAALTNNLTRELASDPSFFDYMPPKTN
jgi:hypothetical protein